MTNPRTKARLEARIHERAAHCLEFEVKDPRSSFVTITRVELSDDLSNGKVYYSVLGSRGDRSRAEHMLASAAGFIQRKVARVLDLRRVPHLAWVYDESIAEAARLEGVIEKALERDRAIQAKGQAPPSEEERGWEAEYDDFADGADEGGKPPARR
jgi:ribosome-binding factor A